jgi:hypothetical protein
VLLASSLAIDLEGIYKNHLKRSLAPKIPFSQLPFVAVVMGVSADNSIEYLCTGSVLDHDKSPSHILTTAFCVSERFDSTGKPVKYQVLIEDPKGTIDLGPSTFSIFEVDKVFQHPNASKISEFQFTSTWPNGSSVNFNVAVAGSDVGIVRLKKSLKDITSLKSVVLSKTIPNPGESVQFAGYGGPQFFILSLTTGTVVIPSSLVQGSSNTPNGEIVFIHDKRNVPSNETQSVEPGDEGSPMLTSDKKQVAIVVGSWQINPNTTSVTTFATLGPAISPNYDFIQSVITSAKVQTSSAFAIVPANVALLIALLWAMI